MDEISTTYKSGWAKVAVQYSADTFVVNQTMVLHINICGKNRHLRQAAAVRRHAVTIEEILNRSAHKGQTSKIDSTDKYENLKKIS